jgi:hypothetical protein
MKDDCQNDLLQNIPFKEPWFTTLWLNGQFKYQMLYEDTTMWACVATSNLQSCIMASIIMHTKHVPLNKYALGDKFQGALDQWSTFWKIF